MPEDLLKPVRNEYLARLLAEGTSTSPIGSHWQGAARLVQGLLGGVEQGREDTKDAALTAAFQKILGGEAAAPVGGPPVAAGAPGAMPAPTVAPRVTTGGQPIGGPTPSTAKVVGDEEGVRLGYYDRAPGGGAAVQPDAANATFNQRFTPPAPAGANTVATVPQGNARDRAAAALLWAGGERGKAIEMAAKKPDERFTEERNPAGNVLGQRSTQTGKFEAYPEDPTTKLSSSLRKEVQDLPSYKNIAQSAPVFKSMMDAVGRDNRASDVNLIYGMAKLMDPGSVVRESEMTIAQAIATLPQQLQATITSQLQGTGRLSPEVRAGIMQEAHSRVSAYAGMFEQDAGFYRGIVGRQKLNEADVVPKFGPFNPYVPTPKAVPPPKAGAPVQVPKEVLDAAIEELKRRQGQK